MSNRLEMRGVRKSFGATQALRGVSLVVAPGEVMALVGENGAGKSTLMKVLSGAIRPDAGEMFLDGEAYVPGNPLHARESGVAMIYQELSLAPHLSVMENILLGVEPGRRGWLDWRTMRQRAATALGEVGLEVDPAMPVRKLSIAQKQLVEIARAVALDCRVLVLDEPTSSLTARDIEKLFGLIARLTARGISVVYISHFLEEVQRISDRFTVLRDGETVGTGATADTPVTQIIAWMVGRNVRELYPKSARTAGEVVAKYEGLELRRGEVVGIAGLIGSGRTEFLRRAFAQGGWSRGVGMVSEDRKTEGLAAGLSVADNLTLPKLDRLVRPSRLRAACRPWIERIPIKCAGPEQRVSDLSGGNQQKVAIARLLHADVDVWLLDEPTRGIDVGSKAEIYRLIDELAAQGKAVLMVSSYLPELLGVCDRIAVMHRGKLSEARPREEWDEHKLMLVATGQEAG